MSVPQSPASTTSSTKLRRDTGVPEPFCGSTSTPSPLLSLLLTPPLTRAPGRNTTLPHPDADLSPNASISSEDVDPSRTTRRSLRARRSRYRHILAHGKITSSSESLHVTTTSSMGGDDDTLAEMRVLMTPDGRISKDLSIEEARASFAADRGAEEGKKRGLIKRILGQ